MLDILKYLDSIEQVFQLLKIGLLYPLRQWLEAVDIQDPQLARFLCKIIPTQCPFERNIQLCGRTFLHIPPLCKFNPLYDQIIELRFRALTFLADECTEDVSQYCC